MTNETHSPPKPATEGWVLHWAAAYDVLTWLFLFGRQRAYRDRLLRLARLGPGERLLDVGCGTGSLALAAKELVGPTGAVHGVDASPEMIARARKKAAKAGADVAFAEGVVESLPFPGGSFDVVTSTLMLHHLPPEPRRQCAAEMRRVLMPGGRVLAVDFAGAGREHGSILGHFHRHGALGAEDIVDLLAGAGMEIVESGPVGARNLQFVLARAP